MNARSRVAPVRAWLLAVTLTVCAPHSEPIATRAPTPEQPGAPRPTLSATRAAAAGPDSAWWAEDPGRISEPRYAGVARHSRYVAMRDGVRLAIDVFLPRTLEPGTRLPAILEQTRYRRSLEPRPELRDSLDRPSNRITAFVSRGDAHFVVDVRGSGASFGSRNVELGPAEVADGRDVVNWRPR